MSHLEVLFSVANRGRNGAPTVEEDQRLSHHLSAERAAHGDVAVAHDDALKLAPSIHHDHAVGINHECALHSAIYLDGPAGLYPHNPLNSRPVVDHQYTVDSHLTLNHR